MQAEEEFCGHLCVQLEEKLAQLNALEASTKQENQRLLQVDILLAYFTQKSGIGTDSSTSLHNLH